MVTIRPAGERLHSDHGWLDSWHTFSFAEHYDPHHMGFRALRVINDDRVAPGQGFGTHPHRDMEIVSYVLEGGLQHRDSMGTGSVIRPGDVQRMTAGTGVFHSEFNASTAELVHFLQIWILPEQKRLAPSYEQKTYPPDSRRGHLTLIGSPDGREGSVTIHQDVQLYSAVLGAGDAVTYPLAAGRHAWAHVARGAVTLGGTPLSAGDGAAISEESRIELVGTAADSDVLIFDLA